MKTSSEITAKELREIVRENKDAGYHRELLRSAATIQRLQAEVGRWKEIAQR